MISRFRCVFFFFNDTATTEIYTLSLHDALPIYRLVELGGGKGLDGRDGGVDRDGRGDGLLGGLLVPLGSFDDDSHVLFADRKSTRLNSSHANISYAVFCLKKKKKNTISNNVLWR